MYELELAFEQEVSGCSVILHILQEGPWIIFIAPSEIPTQTRCVFFSLVTTPNKSYVSHYFGDTPFSFSQLSTPFFTASILVLLGFQPCDEAEQEVRGRLHWFQLTGCLANFTAWNVYIHDLSFTVFFKNASWTCVLTPPSLLLPSVTKSSQQFLFLGSKSSFQSDEKLSRL